MTPRESKLRMLQTVPDRLSPGDIISDSSGELVKVQFINLSGWKSVAISCIKADGLPVMIRWGKGDPIFKVNDPRVGYPKEV